MVFTLRLRPKTVVGAPRCFPERTWNHARIFHLTFLRDCAVFKCLIWLQGVAFPHDIFSMATIRFVNRL